MIAAASIWGFGGLMSLASSFPDERTAERLIASVLDHRKTEVQSWLRHPTGRLTLVEDVGQQTGVSVTRDGAVRTPTGLRIVLLADESAPNGWRILTAFPD